MKFKHLIWLCIVIIATGLAVIPTAAQTCTIRTDWPTYTIVRGDTLFRIASRNHLSTSALAAANCISNTSRIFVGQVLRVPPAGTSSIFETPLTFQQYENGFMIWRGDTGDIWVYTGTSSGTASEFSSYAYGQLPDDPVPDATPAGHVRPIMGFGKVWGNFPSIRTALGWATNPERSFQMQYNRGSGTTFYFSLPDGRTAVTNNSQTWNLAAFPIPTVAAPTPVFGHDVSTWSSYQPFENGFMIWNSEGSVVGVYQGGYGGLVSYFPGETYSNLPDNPFTKPPAGRVRPIFGIGKVWGNFDWVRNTLGWATAPEQSFAFIVSYTTGSPITHFSLPGGRTVYVTNNQLWYYENNGTIPLPAPTPTLTPASQTGTTSTTVNAAYQLFENGFLLWRGDTGRIDLFTKAYVAGYNLSDYQSLPDNPLPDQPPAGRVKPVSGFGRVWGNFVDTRNALGWGLAGEQGFQATFKTDLATSIICVNLPDGRYVSYPHYNGNRSWVWQYENSCS